MEPSLDSNMFFGVCVCVCPPLFLRENKNSRGCQGCTLDWHQRRRQCVICDINPGRWIDVPAVGDCDNIAHWPTQCLGCCRWSGFSCVLQKYLLLTPRFSVFIHDWTWAVVHHIEASFYIIQVCPRWLNSVSHSVARLPVWSPYKGAALQLPADAHFLPSFFSSFLLAFLSCLPVRTCLDPFRVEGCGKRIQVQLPWDWQTATLETFDQLMN